MPVTAGLTTGPVTWAAAFAPYPGESESGDLYLVTRTNGGVLMAVLDGLGHGEFAHQASELAIDTLRRTPAAPLPTLFERCHHRLERSRGAVMTLVRISDVGDMEWAGVGNVDAILLRSGEEPREGLVLKGGIVGFRRLPTLSPANIRLHHGDLVVMVTDGVRGEYAATINQQAPPDSIVADLLEHESKDYDDALALAARFGDTDGQP